MAKFNYIAHTYGFEIEGYMNHQGNTYAILGVYHVKSPRLRFGQWCCIDPYPFYLNKGINSCACKK